MRELKFRAWVPEAESFIFSDDLTGVLDNKTILLWVCGQWSKHQVDCVQQYTGIKDKNSKEIYEGDLVKAFNKDLDFEEGVNEVVFVEGCFVFKRPNALDIPIGKYQSEELEVVGNIFESPELLDA